MIDPDSLTPSQTEDSFSFIMGETEQMLNNNGMEHVNNVVIGLNDCIVNVLNENDIVDETKALMDFATSDQWIQTAEMGTRQELMDGLGEGIDAMSVKMLGVSGTDLTVTMPIEMIDWIRETSILWFKNKGAGHTTTEAHVLEGDMISRLN